MPEFRTDDSGELVFGYFYEFCTYFSNDEVPPNPTGWFFKHRHFDSGRKYYSYADVVDSEEKRIYDCPLNPEHKTESRLLSVTVDVYAGILAPFISCPDVCLVTDELAEQLAASKLKGASIVPAEVNVSYQFEGKESVHGVYFSGRRNCIAQGIFPKSSDRCPFCGFKPILCPACANRNDICPSCRKSTMASRHFHNGPLDPRIKIIQRPREGDVIDPARWDGSDFFGGFLRGYITRRAVDFLLSVDAKPFCAQPVRARIDHLTKEQRERLEEARRPIEKG